MRENETAATKREICSIFLFVSWNRGAACRGGAGGPPSGGGEAFSFRGEACRGSIEDADLRPGGGCGPSGSKSRSLRECGGRNILFGGWGARLWREPPKRARLKPCAGADNALSSFGHAVFSGTKPAEGGIFRCGPPRGWGCALRALQEPDSLETVGILLGWTAARTASDPLPLSP